MYKRITKKQCTIARQRANALIHDVQTLLKDKYIFSLRIVGSGAWGTMIEDEKGEYDLDYQLLLTINSPLYDRNNKKFPSPTQIKKDFLKAFNKAKIGKEIFQDSTTAIVFIDECSTVDNFAMKNLLENLKCRLLVLVGDIFQIRSIKFGNWFSLAHYFLTPEVIYELNTPYRSKNSNMIELWNKVRKLDERTEEFIAIKHYSSEIDDSIFTHDNPDEVILCLNYDGLYGINNINRFLQSDNPNPAFYWDSWVYKVNDPIIFNEFNRFYPTLYNNLKGWIRHIKKESAAIQFDIEVDMPLTEFAAKTAGFELLDCNVPGHSLIRFSVDHYVDDDGREKNSREVVPFQVAYAISIHKAQGLEYNSVKVVVTNEIEELITHNIFYTAITRARQKLRIYWTPETQHKVITEMKPLSCKQDAYIISNKYDIAISSNRN